MLFAVIILYFLSKIRLYCINRHNKLCVILNTLFLYALAARKMKEEIYSTKYANVFLKTIIIPDIKTRAFGQKKRRMLMESAIKIRNFVMSLHFLRKPSFL